MTNQRWLISLVTVVLALGAQGEQTERLTRLQPELVRQQASLLATTSRSSGQRPTQFVASPQLPSPGYLHSSATSALQVATPALTNTKQPSIMDIYRQVVSPAPRLISIPPNQTELGAKHEFGSMSPDRAHLEPEVAMLQRTDATVATTGRQGQPTGFVSSTSLSTGAAFSLEPISGQPNANPAESGPKSISELPQSTHSQDSGSNIATLDALASSSLVSPASSGNSDLDLAARLQSELASKSLGPSDDNQALSRDVLLAETSHQQQQDQTNNTNLQVQEMSNHVLYETNSSAPDNYYFSSSEKLPNNEKASNAWWLLGFGQQVELVNSLDRDDYLDYCSKSDLLISGKQRALCRTHPRILQVVARGLRLAINECQSRFSSSRWNCSLALQESMASDYSSGQSHVFGDAMQRPNRERSFLNAIVAAGLAHAMTKACSQGELPGECSCDKRIRSRNNKGKIEWIGCSDDIDFGSKFSRDFTDNLDSLEADSSAMIDSHNYEVGRRVFKSTTDITCTCQDGDTGLCAAKRCWRHLGSFNDIGDELMKRYESATHVQPSNKDPTKLRPVRRGVRKPKKKDLVFIEDSPDYCQANYRIGVLGTQNRRCNSTSNGPDTCSSLCCGRGYQVVAEEVEEDCNCKFIYCCRLKCDKCKKYVTHDICN